MSEQRARRRAGLPDLGHGHSCTLSVLGGMGVTFLPHLEP